jgi:hypothetical protein
MYTAACHMIESVTNKSLVSFLRERIWLPLHMNNTYFGQAEVESCNAVHQLAQGYLWDGDSLTHSKCTQPDQPEGAGAGEIISCIQDFALWLQCMVNQSLPLSLAGHRELINPRILTGGIDYTPFYGLSAYALGWVVDSFHGHICISHGGHVNGFWSKILYVPQRNWGFVAFANAENGSDSAIERIGGALLEELLEVSERKKTDWRQWEKDQTQNDEEEDIWPDLTSALDAKVPLAQPIDNFGGTYFNKGYKRLIVECKEGRLIADATDRTWRFMLSFEHVSGERFVAEMYDIDTKLRVKKAAEFKLGTDSRVTSLGIAFEKELKGKMIWFDRVV